eukprot:9942417-Alexandrium_andersonii.AAC.1
MAGRGGGARFVLWCTVWEAPSVYLASRSSSVAHARQAEGREEDHISGNIPAGIVCTRRARA